MISRHQILLLMTLPILTCSTQGAPRPVPVPNGGFEDGDTAWTIREPVPMTRITSDRAASGQRSLHVNDQSAEHGSSAASARVRVNGHMGIELRGQVFIESGGGLGLYVRAFDASGREISPDDRMILNLDGRAGQWHAFSATFFTAPEARAIDLWVHSYNAAKVSAFIDDLELLALGPEALRPPWEGTYKIDHVAHPEKLTAADVVGPDGIVYPNWTRVGVEGGIPRIDAVVSIADFGGTPDDDKDDADALDQACRAAAARDGGAVQLAAGTYHLDRPVTISADRIVLRGAGRDRTRIIFRYHLGPDGIRFFNPQPSARIGPDTRIELHALPTNLRAMEIRANNTIVVGEWTTSEHAGNSFSFTRMGRDILGKVPDGKAVLTGTARYADGSTRQTRLDVVLDPAHRDAEPPPDTRGAITFDGAGPTGPRLPLAQDGKRGDTSLVLAADHDLAAGDMIAIEGPATDRWKQLTRNACPWGTYRRYEVRVLNVNGRHLTLDQPLRIEFPVIDGSFVQRIRPIQSCGIEDLSIEQTENLWITTVLFSDAWNCWARNVKVRMCGRHPIYADRAKWCEIRDCVFDDAWFKGGGGTAYVGWEQSYDCLMEDVETFNFRHAPLVQWSASGNVVRNSVFHNSDAQWHSGWTNENLYENCIVTSSNQNGAYGYGMWASPPEDTAHGPNGPRNVVYNCDVTSPRAGLWMGGMNENWLILHNRFVVSSGPGVFMKTASFDHIIKGNVFLLKDDKAPMVRLDTPDCIGVELIDNTLFGGNGKLVAGQGKPDEMDGNEAKSPTTQLPPRPTPSVPSIYQWQLDNVKR